MARDQSLLTERNARIRADYNRLIATEVIVVNRGHKAVIKPTYSQALTILKGTYCITVRTLEGIISATQPVMAPLHNSSSQVTQARA